MADEANQVGQQRPAASSRQTGTLDAWLGVSSVSTQILRVNELYIFGVTLQVCFSQARHALSCLLLDRKPVSWVE